MPPDPEGEAVRVKDSRLSVICWVFVFDAEGVHEDDVVIVTNWLSVPVMSKVSVDENSLVSVSESEKVRVASLVWLYDAVSVSVGEVVRENDSVVDSLCVFGSGVREGVSLAVTADDAVAVEVCKKEGDLCVKLRVSVSVIVFSLEWLLVEFADSVSVRKCVLDLLCDFGPVLVSVGESLAVPERSICDMVLVLVRSSDSLSVSDRDIVKVCVMEDVPVLEAVTQALGVSETLEVRAGAVGENDNVCSPVKNLEADFPFDCVSSSVRDPEKDLLCTTVASVPVGDGVSAVRDTLSLGEEVPDGVGVGVRVFSLLKVSNVGESVPVKFAVFDCVDEPDLLACSFDPVLMVRVVLESVFVPMELESLSVMESVADRAGADRVLDRLMYTDGEMVPVLAGADRVLEVVCSCDGVCDDEYVYDSGAVMDILGVIGLLDSEKLMVCDWVSVMVSVLLRAPVKE